MHPDVERVNRVIDESNFSYDVARQGLQELRDEWGTDRFIRALCDTKDIAARQTPHFGPSLKPRRRVL